MATINLTPQEIVAQLDKHIVGQAAAKRAVAIAVRNRWPASSSPPPSPRPSSPKTSS